MNSKAKKTAPLFFILIITLGALAYTPTAASGNATATPQVQASRNPAILDWTKNASSYAAYNGHYSEWQDRWNTGWSKNDAIITGDLRVAPNGAKTVSNISIEAYEFFTHTKELDMQGIWYNVSTSTGKIVDMQHPTSGILGNYSFFYVKTMPNINVGEYVIVTTPFDSEKSSIYYVNKTETVLGIETKQLIRHVDITIDFGGGVTYTRQSDTILWISNNTQGLLMRFIGSDRENVDGTYWWHRSMDMSLEIGQTNILDLVPLSIPEGIVPWMSTGKYLQYNLQGSGYVDASLINHTGGVTWQLPGDTKFGVTVSANITLKVDRGTTAYVDPYRSSRYVWVLHAMLNNTRLLLPDLRRAVYYLNHTVGAPVPLEMADYIISTLSPFNHTGLVIDTWFLVDNASGRAYWPGVHFDTLADYSPSTTEDLGSLLSEGLGFQVLSYFAQGVLFQDWSISNPTETQTISGGFTNTHMTRTMSGTAVASITAVGTEYLEFPGGGGGHCWRLEPTADVHVTQSTTINRADPPSMGMQDVLFGNFTLAGTSSGYIDVERTSGFPLGFQLSTTLSESGGSRFMPYFWFSTSITVHLDLSATVPRTNIWFSNPPVYLTMGMGGGNATTPDSTFGSQGFDIWMNGANDVVVTSSASQPPDSAAPPNGTLPFVYLDIKGVPAGGGNIILYVYYNRTRVQALHIDENSLKLYTFNATSHNWQALQTTHLTINATYGVLFAILPHLSYFAVLGASSTGGGAGGIPTLYILIAAVAVIAVLAAVVYLRKGKSKGGLK